jgi:prolyl-tRNA editing enzyme YbaK/EbsC (Cys-tRNA(Pro) deacylase)
MKSSKTSTASLSKKLDKGLSLVYKRLIANAKKNKFELAVMKGDKFVVEKYGK